MAIFQCRLRGTTYFGKPAGSGGDTFDVSSDADEDHPEQILYYDMVEETGGLFTWLFGARTTRVIKTGYVSRSTISALDDVLGLHDPVRHRQQMERSPLPPGTYALYRAK